MPKAPVQMQRVIKVLKDAREPVTSIEVAERVGTSRQNAYNIIKGRLVPVGLAKVVGKSDTLAELYAWDPGVEKEGVEPAPRQRAGSSTEGRRRDPSSSSSPSDTEDLTESGVTRANGGSDTHSDGNVTHELRREDPSSTDVPTHRARVKVTEGGQVEVLEVEGITREELLGFWQPYVGKQIEVRQLRLVPGGVVEMDVVVDGKTQTLELKTVA